jgi:hypothetical protein
MKERTQGKAKLHIVRDERRMGRMDKAIKAMNRPRYNPAGEEQKRRQHALEQWDKAPRPHEAPCACHFCKCYDAFHNSEER